MKTKKKTKEEIKDEGKALDEGKSKRKKDEVKEKYDNDD